MEGFVGAMYYLYGCDLSLTPSLILKILSKIDLSSYTIILSYALPKLFLWISNICSLDCINFSIASTSEHLTTFGIKGED